MRTSENINELAKALSQAQGKIENATKDTSNPFFNSKYADLAGVINVAKAALSENNLSVVQVSKFEDERWILVTRLTHSSGQWIEGYHPILSDKQNAQGFGSGMTYARRYALAAILGIAQEDDDGNGATDPNKKETKKLDQKKVEPKKEAIDLKALITATSMKQLVQYASDKKVKNEQMVELLSLMFGKKSSKEINNGEFSEIMQLLRSKSLDEINLFIVEKKTEKEMNDVVG